MQRHPIAATWGRSDLASSDMMTMETTKRVWQARLDPRRNTPSIGIYSDRKSTRLNSSHLVISYAVFCLKKKKKYIIQIHLAHKHPIDDERINAQTKTQ